MFSSQSYIRNKKNQERFALKKLNKKELEEFHNILLEMYRDILGVCEMNNIKILLGGGSALGAVRHSGFIPWDEDIDLMISASDFEVFVSTFQALFSHKYYIISPLSSSRYPYMLMQIVKKGTYTENIIDVSKIRPTGVSIDINIIINTPNNRIIYLLHGGVSNILYFLINSKSFAMTLSKRAILFFSGGIIPLCFYAIRVLIGFCLFPFSYKSLCSFFYEWTTLYKVNSINKTIATGRRHYFGECLKSYVFFPAKLTLFEGLNSYIPNRYEDYLENLFGSDFMDIPPEDKQEPHAYMNIDLDVDR